MTSREDYVYLAKLAEQAERYEGTFIDTAATTYMYIHALMLVEMVENMKHVAALGQELSVEERNLLSVAYKNSIGARRASWRIVSSIEQKEASKGNDSHVAMIKEYRSKIETELRDVCDDILNVLDTHLIGNASNGEAKVFYLKM